MTVQVPIESTSALSFVLKAKAHSIERDYEQIGIIGEVFSGKIYMYNNRKSNQKVVVKKLSNNADGRNEIRLHRDASYNCPYILKILDLYDYSNSLYLATEYMEGGDLLNWTWKRNLDESDLKLENILVRNVNNRIEVKIADFGFAKLAECGMTSPKYTVQYASPQQLGKSKTYTKSTDIWSLGVILYKLCCGYFPYIIQSRNADVSRIDWKSLEIEFDPQKWSHISREARDLISRMLTVDPRARPTIHGVMIDPWFIKHHDGSTTKKVDEMKQILHLRKMHEIPEEELVHLDQLYNEVRAQEESPRGGFIMKSLPEIVENRLLKKRQELAKKQSEYNESGLLVTLL